jgi:Skp family chaperone for outer membrane proteins
MTMIAVAALALAGAGAPAFADTPPAQAQSAIPLTYGFVDMIRVMRETTAAKGVNDELVARKAALKADFDKKASALRDEGRALGKEHDTLSKDEFEKKARAMEEKISELNHSTDERKMSFENVVNQSMSKVRDLAGDTIEAVAQEHRYAAVFSREAVIIGAKDLDITDEVIKRMNASGKKVAVDWSAKPKKPGLVVDGQ